MTVTTNTETAPTKSSVDLDERCKRCIIKTYQRLFEKFNAGKAEQQKFMSFYGELVNTHKYLSTPEIHRELNQAFCRIINVSNPFSEEKSHSNTLALGLYKEWKPKVMASADAFNLALRLSIAGNIMDYGAGNDFDIHQTIQSVMKASFAIDHSPMLKERIKKARHILFLGDNAGEIVFDKLFIETLARNEITYVVKGAPVLNDVTMEDAAAVKMSAVAEVISNGYDAPSTILHKGSSEFLERYHSADLIISKGQGNLEGLLDAGDDRIFFLLMVKCNLMAGVLGVKKGSIVVYHSNKMEYGKN